MNTHLRIALTAFSLLFGLTNAFSQPNLRFDVVGNKIGARLAPGDVAHLYLSATADGPGTLKLKIEETDRPAFVPSWNDTSLVCGRDCELEVVLELAPTGTDCGEYRFVVVASFDGASGRASAPRTITGSVYPRLLPEPPFTAGDQNEVCWAGCLPHRDHLVVFPDIRIDVKPALNSLLSADPRCETVPLLAEGVRYTYTVMSRLDGADGVLIERESSPEYSTQDNSPPKNVIVTGFTVDEQARVGLRWQNSSDSISPLDEYHILRSEPGVSSGFDTLVVLPFGAVRVLTPQNYLVKAKPAEDDTLYIDDTVTIDDLPDVLKDAYLVRGANRDRWNESSEFLRFRVGVESDIYVAYDNKKKPGPFPKWLREPHFIPTNMSLGTSEHQDRLKLHKSMMPIAGGELVTLGGNFSEGVLLNTDTPMYAVFVVPRDTTPEMAAGQVEFTDELLLDFPDLDQRTFRYRIDAVDAARNLAQGDVSAPVIIDFKGKCRPEIAKWFVRKNARGKFGKGTTNMVQIADPVLNAECDLFRATDSVRFQAVRDGARFFGLRLPQERDSLFFDSGWLAVEDLDTLKYRFDLLPDGKTADFVDGFEYFYRAKSKDIHGNESAWSDTVSAIQDALPPGDISNLSVLPEVSPDCKTANMNVTWDEADDRNGSGVAKYQVFRKFEDESAFAQIGEVAATETSFRDTPALDSSKVACYRIGSVDNLGFVHNIAQSTWEKCARVPIGPIVQPDTTTGELVVCGNVTGTNRDTVTVRIDGNRNGVLKYILTVNDDRITIRNISDRKVLIPLLQGDGLYKISAQAEYESGPSTCSDTLRVVRKATPPAPVQNLVARHDPNRTGNIILEWDPIPPDSLFEIEILKACQGDSTIDSVSVRPEQTSVVFDSLVGYQCCNFTVRVRDCFGNFADAGVSQYSDLPPMFLRSKVKVDTINAVITVCWKRPQPRVTGSGSFRPTIEVYKEFVSDASQLLAEDVFDGDGDGKTDTCFTFKEPERKTNYVFRVQERLLDAPSDQTCSAQFTSAWSDTCTVPYLNLPVPVTNLLAQALPVHPDSTTGSVFVTWPNYIGDVDSFWVVYWQTEGPRDTIAISGVDTARIFGLKVDSTFVTVIAIDDLGQQSRDNAVASASFEPVWKFTPMVSEFIPGCFKDSVTVLWQWKDMPQPTTTCGADSVQIALTIDSEFRLDSPRTVTPWLPVTGMLDTTAGGPIVGAWKFWRGSDYGFISNSHSQLYAQIHSKDSLGHFSPWSSVYDELESQPGHFDELPPPDAVCRVTAVAISDITDTAFVTLEWDDMMDGCSGTAFYELARNDSIISQVPSRMGFHVYVDTVTASILESYEWSVFASDSLGNRTVSPRVCGVRTDISPPAVIECAGERTVCWQSVEPPTRGDIIEYFPEAAPACSQLGKGGGRELPGWISDTCFTVISARSENSLCWRVKARFISGSDTVESVWSSTETCPLGDIPSSVEPATGQLVPSNFVLAQNYPNPFNPSTTIRFGLPVSVGTEADVSIVVFNLAGQRVRTLLLEPRGPGMHQVVWDGRDSSGRLMGSGVYIYRLSAGTFTESKKMVFVK